MRTCGSPSLVSREFPYVLGNKMGGADESTGSKEKYNDLKKEYNTLQQENSKLQAIIQDVTSVNKRWQQYNNDRQVYVQKLLQTIQDLQEQINLSSEKKAKEPVQDQTESLKKQIEQLEKKHKETIENLKREHADHTAVLELQIKSYKSDWEAERRDKVAAVENKELLDRRIKDLTLEIQKLTEERTRCEVCLRLNSKLFEQVPTPTPMKVCKTILPKTYRTSVHVPYSSSQLLSKGSSLFFDDELVKDGFQMVQERLVDDIQSTSSALASEENISIDKYTESSSFDHDSGIALSFSEKYPVYNFNDETYKLKSILKKEERKKCTEQMQNRDEFSKYFCNSVDSKTHTEHYEKNQMSLGFLNSGLANITMFQSDSEYISKLEVPTQSNISVSAPSTRNNSSGDLKPLRECSSWEGVDTETSEDVICPTCDAVFPPPSHLQFLSHFDICQKKSNGDKTGASVS